jgi:hypothetical protein
MKKNKIFLKKILSYIPFLNKFIKKIYYKKKYGTIFIPINFKFSNDQILKDKTYELNLENFDKLKKKFDYFLISDKKSILNYSESKLKKLIELVKNKGFNLIEKHILPNEIDQYQEAFLTGTAAEITPIQSIDEINYNVGNNTATFELMNDFTSLVNSSS